MTGEKVPVDQIIQKLGEASIKNSTRLNDFENKLDEICQHVAEQNKEASLHLSSEIMTMKNNMAGRIEAIEMQTREMHDTTIMKLEESQQRWNHLMSDVHEMKVDLQKVIMAITTSQESKTINNDPTTRCSSTSDSHRNSPTINESFGNSLSFKNSTARQIRQDENVSPQTAHYELAMPATQTIIIPPPSAIPTFYGNMSENPRQFLIRIKEYTETVNHWNDSSLLKGISQFLRDTALEWYCQLRISHRRPQTWPEFATLFLAQFNSPIRRARQEQEWRECKQHEDETINEFVVRLRTLWTEQKPKETETDLVRRLLCKMRSDLLHMIGISRGESLDEIIIEAQKIEEILYQRSKQQRQHVNKQVSFRDRTPPPSMHYKNNQIGLQTISPRTIPSHQPDTVYNSSTQHNNSTSGRFSGSKSSQYSNYSTQPTSNRQYVQSTDSPICYACGLNGHIKRNCPSQYNSQQSQYSRNHHSKNENGAHVGRDYDAPM